MGQVRVLRMQEVQAGRLPTHCERRDLPANEEREALMYLVIGIVLGVVFTFAVHWAMKERKS